MPNCELCSKETALERGICKDCRREHALPTPTEPLRPRIPCARCGGGSFVRAYAIRERAATGHDHVSEYIAALSLSYHLMESETFWGGRKVKSTNLGKPMGLLEAYACRQCGFTEFYTQRPDEIEIGETHATELFEVDGGAGYRG
jgi:ribosomal protein S27AE